MRGLLHNLHIFVRGSHVGTQTIGGAKVPIPAARTLSRGSHGRSTASDGFARRRAFADLFGLYRTYIGSIERAERNVSIDNIEQIANALQVEGGKLVRSD